jgi:hypothetical protein
MELGVSDRVADADFAMSLSDFWRRTAYFEGAAGASFYVARPPMVPFVSGGSFLNSGFGLRSIAVGPASIARLLWFGLGCAHVRYSIELSF